MRRASRDWDDDYDDDRYDYDDRPVKKKGGNNTLLWVLLGSGAAFLLLACFAGIVGFAVFSAMGGTQPDEYVGSWKARWTVGGVAFDSIYTFNKDGTFREQSFDLQGRPMRVSDGRWRFRNGQIEINWLNGGFEHATATHVDAQTIHYQIVRHTDPQQVGLAVTLRRQ